MVQWVYSQVQAPETYLNINLGGHGEQFVSTQENFFEDLLQTIETGTTDGERKPASPHRTEFDWNGISKASLVSFRQKFLN